MFDLNHISYHLLLFTILWIMDPQVEFVRFWSKVTMNPFPRDHRTIVNNGEEKRPNGIVFTDWLPVNLVIGEQEDCSQDKLNLMSAVSSFIKIYVGVFGPTLNTLGLITRYRVIFLAGVRYWLMSHVKIAMRNYVIKNIFDNSMFSSSISFPSVNFLVGKAQLHFISYCQPQFEVLFFCLRWPRLV